jgi:hypothetical protein
MNKIKSLTFFLSMLLCMLCFNIQEAAAAPTSTPAQNTVEYIEIIDSCGPRFEGGCVNARSGPGTKYKSVGKLRTGMVLRISSKVTVNEKTWYKISFKEHLFYPERLTSDWYVSADYAKLFSDKGTIVLAGTSKTSKRIVVDLSKQKISAYDGNTLFMEQTVSTGIKTNPTPRGTYTVFKKTPSRYMQGPIPGRTDDEYDLPGVPWNLYFTERGVVFHGAYWHEAFGRPYSHGCVNLPLDKAKELYMWADIGTKVTVK